MSELKERLTKWLWNCILTCKSILACCGLYTVPEILARCLLNRELTMHGKAQFSKLSEQQAEISHMAYKLHDRQVCFHLITVQFHAHSVVFFCLMEIPTVCPIHLCTLKESCRNFLHLSDDVSTSDVVAHETIHFPVMGKCSGDYNHYFPHPSYFLIYAFKLYVMKIYDLHQHHFLFWAPQSGPKESWTKINKDGCLFLSLELEFICYEAHGSASILLRPAFHKLNHASIMGIYSAFYATMRKMDKWYLDPIVSILK